MREIRKILFEIIFRNWLIAFVFSTILSIILSNAIPTFSFWMLFAGNVVGATGVAIYFYVKEYIKIKRIINEADKIIDKIKENIINEKEDEETKIQTNNKI